VKGPPYGKRGGRSTEYSRKRVEKMKVAWGGGNDTKREPMLRGWAERAGPWQNWECRGGERQSDTRLKTKRSVKAPIYTARRNQKKRGFMPMGGGGSLGGSGTQRNRKEKADTPGAGKQTGLGLLQNKHNAQKEKSQDNRKPAVRMFRCCHGRSCGASTRNKTQAKKSRNG